MDWQVEFYKARNGRVPVLTWLESLDKDIQLRIRKRLRFVSSGHLGDCKYLGEDLFELRFFFGAGYRVYFAKVGTEIILLLQAGDKKKQSTDILKAKNYLEDYKERNS